MSLVKSSQVGALLLSSLLLLASPFALAASPSAGVDNVDNTRSHAPSAAQDQAVSGSGATPSDMVPTGGTSKNAEQLRGTVTRDDVVVDPTTAVDQLFSLNPNDEAADASDKRKHFHLNQQVLMAKGRNILNYVFDYRAFGPSTEAANVILDEHGKARSTEATAYDQQRELDTKHLQTIRSMMQLAMGIGMSDTARGQKSVETSLTTLRGLVGEKRANLALSILQDYNKTLPKSADDQELLDFQQQQQMVEKIVASAVSRDEMLQLTTKDLHKYNRRSKALINGVGLLQSALGVASFSPTLAAPIAETAYFVLMMATGGPEQDKLLRELYLSKCLEDRRNVVNEKAHLAVESYQMAAVSKNPLLQACSQAMVRQMCGAPTVQDVFAVTPAADSAVSAQTTAPAAVGNGDDQGSLRKTAGLEAGTAH